MVLTRDDQSEKVEQIQIDFLRQHPERAQSARLLRQYAAERASRGLTLDGTPLNGETLNGE
jgi:hypothetical protein